jgi:5-methylcytosine-specific restriction endonuclease McrBC regulatory subunit McrC
LLKDLTYLKSGKTNNCPANFNEDSIENLPNQLIKQALKMVVLLSGLSQHKIKAQQLLIAFNDIPNCTVKAETLRAWQHSVGPVHQQYLKKLTAVILGPFSQQATTSSPAIDAYMYPAEILFERYVARQLEQVLNTPAPAIRQKPAKALLATNGRQTIEIKCQEQVQSLFQKQTGPFAKTYALRPDIVIRKKSTNQQEKPAVLIMDTKWKTYTEQNNAVAQADLYQMLAYGSYYMGKEANSTLQLAIIAPATAFFNGITGPHLYAVQGNTIELWMLPFDLLKPQACFVKSQIPGGLLGEVLGRCWEHI